MTEPVLIDEWMFGRFLEKEIDHKVLQKIIEFLDNKRHHYCVDESMIPHVFDRKPLCPVPLHNTLRDAVIELCGIDLVTAANAVSYWMYLRGLMIRT